MSGNIGAKVREGLARCRMTRRKSCGAARLRGKRTVLSALLVIAAGFGIGIVGGIDRVHADTGSVVDPSELKDLVPLEEIIDKAKAEHDGQLIEAELKKRDGIDVYETEILDEEGKVWEMDFNAKTGELLQQSQERANEKERAHAAPGG